MWACGNDKPVCPNRDRREVIRWYRQPAQREACYQWWRKAIDRQDTPSSLRANLHYPWASWTQAKHESSVLGVQCHQDHADALRHSVDLASHRSKRGNVLRQNITNGSLPASM